MERDLAIRMIAALKSLDAGLNEATKITIEMSDKEEAKLLRRHLGKLMSGPMYDLIAHVVRQYPDLDPDRQP